MLVLDGVVVSQKLRSQLKTRASRFRDVVGRPPGLSVILVGEDPASHIYVRNKEKACEEVGIRSVRYDLDAKATSESIRSLIKKINSDDEMDGLLIQLPLPGGLDPQKTMTLVDPRKDVDCLTAENLGLLFTGRPRVRSCTPYGVMKILEHYKIPVSGRHAVVIGKSNIVGKPMAAMLWDAEATVSICHSKTRDLRNHTKLADLIVVAVGKEGLIGRDETKQGAVVVDVGINRNSEGKLCGDVRTEELRGWAHAVTPVPKGVGPMTITMLLENTLHLAELRSGKLG